MNNSTKTEIEKVIETDRELRPHFYKTLDDVARIIDPASYAEGWHHNDRDIMDLQKSRRSYMKSIAQSKAHEILKYLGFHVDTDWYEILSRIEKEDNKT